MFFRAIQAELGVQLSAKEGEKNGEGEEKQTISASILQYLFKDGLKINM